MTTLFSLRPVFAVDKGNYVKGGGGGGFEKLCVPLEKSWLCPWESSSVLFPPHQPSLASLHLTCFTQ